MYSVTKWKERERGKQSHPPARRMWEEAFNRSQDHPELRKAGEEETDRGTDRCLSKRKPAEKKKFVKKN